MTIQGNVMLIAEGQKTHTYSRKNSVTSTPPVAFRLHAKAEAQRHGVDTKTRICVVMAAAIIVVEGKKTGGNYGQGGYG